MKNIRQKTKRFLLKSFSAFFIVWLSGVLVLVGCSSHFFNALAMNKTDDEVESCPIKGHECCKKKAEAEKNSTKVSEDENKPVDCCAFKPFKTLSADLKNSKNSKQSHVVSNKIETPQPVLFIKQTYKIPQIYHSAIRNRGSTYLQNCNFRI